MQNFDYVKRNFDELSGEIDLLGKRYSDDGVTLVSVTKSAEDDEVLALAAAGCGDIGENRPQMLIARGDLLSANGYKARLHEIGNLQKNKVRHIINRADLIHSLDSAELAAKIDSEAQRAGIVMPVLIEINSAKELAKGGIMPEEAERFAELVLECRGLQLAGLMTMGPVTDTPEQIRPYFRLTKKLFDAIGKKYGYYGKGILSMGMSDSYGVAIEEGSTLVRVGRRLFIK